MDMLSLLNDINSSGALPYILIRTIFIYLYAIFLIRMNIRLRLETTFDFVLVIIYSTIVGSAIYGGSLLNTLGVSLVLISIHKIFSVVSYYSRESEKFLKARSIILYSHGRFDTKTMKRLLISKSDIYEACRIQLHQEKLKEDDTVRLEASGKLSILPQTGQN